MRDSLSTLHRTLNQFQAQGSPQRKGVEDIIMTTKSLLHLCLVLLFTTEISSLHCTMLYFQQNKVNQDSLKLLEKMSGNFPSQCINERMALKPTQEIVQLPLSQNENAKIIIQGLLQEIFSVFSKDLTQTSWDRSLIARFQNGLYQQIQRLEACMGALAEEELSSPEGEDVQLTSRRAKKYFQEINTFLKKNQYSLCAWEIVHREISEWFQLIDKLTKRLKY